jgi:tetratricopeptide (TPR) repeat protein
MYQEALEAGRRRDYARAIQLLTEVVAHTDEYPDAPLYLGRAYHAVGDYRRAVQLLEFFLRTSPSSTAARFFLARSLLSLEHYERASRLLLYVVRRQPDLAQARGLLGYALLKQQRPTLAVKYLESALRLEPENSRLRTAYHNALLVDAVRSFRKGQTSSSARALLYVARRRPDSLLPHVYLGRIYKEAGELRKALYHYERARELAPSDPALAVLKAAIHLGLGEGEKASQELTRAGALWRPGLTLPSDPSVLIKILVVAMAQARRHTEAVRYGRMSLRADYRDAQVHAAVAEAHLALGDALRAKNHFERAIQYGGNRLEFHYGRALSLWNLGEHDELGKAAARMGRLWPDDSAARYFAVLAASETEEAGPELIAAIQEAIRETGPDLHLMACLGKAYVDTGLDELAVGWLERTLRLDAGNGSALLTLLDVYSRLERHDELGETYRKAVERFPDDDDLRRRYIRHLVAGERYQEGVEQILALLPRHPRSRTLRKSLAQCHLMTGAFDEAAVLYRELLRNEPNSIPILRSLVLCLDRLNDQRAAIELLRKAAIHFEDDLQILLPLGVLHIKTGDYAEAQTAFRKVLAVDPRNWQAYHNLARACRGAGQHEFADRFFETARRYRAAANKSS